MIKFIVEMSIEKTERENVFSMNSKGIVQGSPSTTPIELGEMIRLVETTRKYLEDTKAAIKKEESRHDKNDD